MSSYVVQNGVDGCISQEEESRLIDKAEAAGNDWYFDLGEIKDGVEPVNMLIIED